MKVSVFCPNGDGRLSKLVALALMRMQANPLGHSVSFQFPTWTPYEHNIHRCMNQAIEDGADFMLSMDCDNPPTRNPLELVDLDLDLPLDVVGLPTPVWHSAVIGDRPWYLNAYDYVPAEDAYRPHEPCEGLQEVDAIGSGCFLVARRVLVAMQNEQPFLRKWNADGTVHKGADIAFCERARAKGFHIWAHYDYVCEHVQSLPLLEVIRAFGAMTAPRPHHA